MIVTDLNSIGKQIRKRRLELRLSQSEVAERIGTTRQWLSRLEQGREGASVIRLLDVCAELDLVTELRAPSPSPVVIGSTSTALSPSVLKALSPSLRVVPPHLPPQQQDLISQILADASEKLAAISALGVLPTAEFAGPFQRARARLAKEAERGSTEEQHESGYQAPLEQKDDA